MKQKIKLPTHLASLIDTPEKRMRFDKFLAEGRKKYPYKKKR